MSCPTVVKYLCVFDQEDRGLFRFHHSRHIAMVHSPAPAALELGDRFEVFPVDSTERLKLPRVLGPDGFPIERIEAPTGRLLEVEVELDPVEHSAVVPGLGRGVTNPASTFWLEYQGSGRFRLIVEPVVVPLGDGEQTTEQGVRIEFDSQDRSVVLSESSFSAGLFLQSIRHVWNSRFRHRRGCVGKFLDWYGHTRLFIVRNCYSL